MAISTGANVPMVTEESIEIAVQEYRRKRGRPCDYTPEIAGEIITRLASGETLRGICESKHLPGNYTIYDWMDKIPGFASAIKRARKHWAASATDSGMDIIDQADDSKGLAPVTKADKQAMYRLALAKVYDRDLFGDKQAVEHSGGNISFSFGLSQDQAPPVIEINPSE